MLALYRVRNDENIARRFQVDSVHSVKLEKVELEELKFIVYIVYRALSWRRWSSSVRRWGHPSRPTPG
jgi:hypothetical protein